MTVFWIAFINAIKMHVRNITPFIMQVLSTLLIIIILGSTLGGNFNTGTSINPLRVALVNEDSGETSTDFVNFLNSSSLENLIKISQVSDIEAAQLSLKQNKYDSVIEINSNYSEDYADGNFTGIKTYILNNDKITFQIISSIINGWENNSSAIQIAIKNGVPMNSILTTLQNNNQIIKEMPLSNSGELPKAIDYYAITMAILTLIFSGVNTIGRLKDDFLSEMRNRFQSSPTPIGYILTGELLGVTLMSFLQMVFVLLFAHFVYGANLGNNWGIVFGTLFIMTLFGQMLAAVLILGLKNADAPQGLIGVLAIGLTFLSGGIYASPIKGTIGKFLVTYGTPNSLAQTAIFGGIYGGDIKIIFSCMGILGLISLILMGLSIIFAKRRILS